MAEVIEIDDIEQLTHYRTVWAALWRQTRGASLFQSLDWLTAYWKWYGQDKRLSVLIVRSDDRPIGVVPLVYSARRTRLGTFRTLGYPLDDWGAFFGPVGPNPTATLMAAMRHVRRASERWDLVELQWVDQRGVDHRRTETAMLRAALRPTSTVSAQAAVIDTSIGWDRYWAGRDARWRSNVRRNERRLNEAGRVQHIRYRPAGASVGDDDPRWDLYRQCEQVAAESWQASAGEGVTLCDARARPFLRDVHQRAVRLGAVDLNLLRLDGRPIAFAYNYLHDDELFGLRTGFAAGAPAGAGTVLLYRAIRDSFLRGDPAYNLGAGYLAHKRHWWTHVRPVVRHVHYPTRAPTAQMLRLKHYFQARLSQRRAG